MGIKHTKVSGVADGANTDLVRPSNWNADHTIDGDVNFSGFDITNCGNFPAVGPEGPEGPQGPPGTGTLWINVEDFGAVGDNSNDDTSAIQAAIDYAYANRLPTVYIPAGQYKITVPLFLDAPLNLRGSAAAWAIGTNYALNDLVTHLGVPWISLSAGNLGNTPAMGSAFWSIKAATSSVFGFCFNLIGDNGCGSHDNEGSNIRPNYTGGVALFVGPGQGNRIAQINILGATETNHNYRGTIDSASVGIAIAGHGGGTSKVLIEQCFIERFYTLIGVDTAATAPSLGLGDSTTLVKCTLTNGYYGTYFGGTQNFVNSLYDCVISDCTRSVNSQVGCGCNVFGGNYSPGSSVATKLEIASTSNFVTVNIANTHYYTFDAVLTAPAWSAIVEYDWNGQNSAVSHGGELWYSDGSPTIGDDPPGDGWQRLDNLLYPNDVFNAFVLDTANFGLIPLRIGAYNTATKTASFSTDLGWVGAFGGDDRFAVSDLDGDIAATTEIYAIELPTVFAGNGLNISGVHVEESLVGALTVMDTGSGFGSQRPSAMCGSHFNSDLSVGQYGPGYPWATAFVPTTWQRAQYYVAKVFPSFISRGANTLSLRDNCLGNTFEQINMQGGAHLITEGNTDGEFQYIADALSDYTMDNDGPGYGPYLVGTVSTVWEHHQLANEGRSKFIGVKPSPWETPRLTMGQWVALAGANPGITAPGGTYPVTFNLTSFSDWPMIWGGQNYAIGDDVWSQIALPRPMTVALTFGRNGAGSVAITSRAGDAVLWVTDLTNQVDLTSSFERVITVQNQIQQTSAANLSAVKLQIGYKTPQFVRSSHMGYTYGADIVAASVPNLGWSYQGKSSTVYCNQELLQLMFPGLMIKLIGAGAEQYHQVVTIFRQLGQMTVAPEPLSGHALAGTSGVTYTGTTVTQQPLDLQVM